MMDNTLQNSSQSLHTRNDGGEKKTIRFAFQTNWLEINPQQRFAFLSDSEKNSREKKATKLNRA
jgi:hypothetical protein